MRSMAKLVPTKASFFKELFLNFRSLIPPTKQRHCHYSWWMILKESLDEDSSRNSQREAHNWVCVWDDVASVDLLNPNLIEDFFHDSSKHFLIIFFLLFEKYSFPLKLKLSYPEPNWGFVDDDDPPLEFVFWFQDANVLRLFWFWLIWLQGLHLLVDFFLSKRLMSCWFPIEFYFLTKPIWFLPRFHSLRYWTPCWCVLCFPWLHWCSGLLPTISLASFIPAHRVGLLRLLSKWVLTLDLMTWVTVFVSLSLFSTKTSMTFSCCWICFW